MPTLVIEAGIASWTGNEPMRRASFKGLREDKSTESIVFETPAAPPSR
jgi:ATP-dependent DNA ligase